MLQKGESHKGQDKSAAQVRSVPLASDRRIQNNSPATSEAAKLQTDRNMKLDKLPPRPFRSNNTRQSWIRPFPAIKIRIHLYVTQSKVI
jgi:hypothetical protein